MDISPPPSCLGRSPETSTGSSPLDWTFPEYLPISSFFFAHSIDCFISRRDVQARARVFVVYTFDVDDDGDIQDGLIKSDSSAIYFHP